MIGTMKNGRALVSQCSLCSPFAKLTTGGVIYVDGGYKFRG
jgi:enoyl-[acyl-carrier-protein] reductase (NADH)